MSNTIKTAVKNANEIAVAEHIKSANVKKVLDGLIVAPSTVVNLSISDPSAAAIKVGQGNLLRIRVTAATFVIFGNPDSAAMSAPTGAESNSIELNAAGVYVLVCADQFVMTSEKPARMEIITG